MLASTPREGLEEGLGKVVEAPARIHDVTEVQDEVGTLGSGNGTLGSGNGTLGSGNGTLGSGN